MVRGLRLINKDKTMRDYRVVDYILPLRVIEENNASGYNGLLTNNFSQASMAHRAECTLEPNGYIVLDFGKEIYGGIEIIAGKISELEYKVLVSFGESLSETFSHPNHGHTKQELIATIPQLSNTSHGELGFRFVKIENLEPFSISLQAIRGRFIHREFKQCASFNSSDKLLNEIFNTAVYTLNLCTQNYVYDGIKRDKMVWMGDLFAELIPATLIYGKVPEFERSMDFLRDETPIPNVMNSCVNYSMYWILAQEFWFRHFGALDYLKEQKSYLIELLENFFSMVSDTGKVNFKGGFLLLDWATGTKIEDEEAILSGSHGLLLITLRAGRELCLTLGEVSTAQKCTNAIAKMKQFIPPLTHSTSANAFLALAKLYDTKTVYEKCFKDQLPNGLSTFLGCFVLDVCAMEGKVDMALDAVRQYWGGMLELGSTTFWEHFDVKWLENAMSITERDIPNQKDVHATYGEGCYEKYRNSLCHGWGAMVAEWLIRNIVGVSFINANTLKISPNLCNLEFVECLIPMPQGDIYIKVTPQESIIEAPNYVIM